MEFKGAIFDMDGLLFDTERIYQQTWHEIAGERNIVLGDEFIKRISGTAGADTFHIIEEYYHVTDGVAIAEDCVERVKNKLAVHLPIKEGVHEILDCFKQKNVAMALASSSGMQQIESNLHVAGIRDYFQAVVSGAEIGRGKPYPDIFLCAAEKIGHRPEDCLVFEDSENGIKAGHAAGCITIMIPDLMEASPEILPYCSKVCSSLLEFVHYL